MKDKIGFGFIGIGAISKTHTLAINECENCYFAAAYDKVPGKAEAYAAEHGGKGYSSLEEFLSDENVDAVVVATPSGLHMDLAIEALKRGKHVLIEKPLEITYDRCLKIIRTAKENNCLLSGIFQSRFYDAPRLIKKALDDGRFGRLVMVEASVKWFRSQTYYDSGAWRGTWKIDGGGALMNQSIHAIDLLSWFGGEVESISGVTGTLAHERIEVEDAGAAVLKFKNGAIGIIEGSTGIYPGFQKRIEICGTNGSAILEEESLVSWSFDEETEEDEEIRRKYLPSSSLLGGASDPGAINYIGHKRQFDDFARAVKEGGKPFISAEAASESVKIINGIYESAKKGKQIAL